MKRHAKASSVGSNLGSGNSRASSRTRFLVLPVLAFALLAVLSASSALAANTHPYTGVSFGPNGTGAGSTFSETVGATFDPSTNNVYVFDGGEGGKIYKFDAAGNPVDFSGSGPDVNGNAIEGVGALPFPGLNQIAIAPSGSPAGTAGDIYVAAYPKVLIYGSDGEKLGELAGGGEPCGVAADPSGHVFVGYYPATVKEFVPTANPFTAADLTATSSANLPEICNVAVDGLGSVYAANYEGSQGVFKLDGLDAASATPVDPKGATLAVDPSTNDVYVDRGASVAQYDSSGGLVSVFGAAQLSGSFGVAVSANGEKVYVSNGKSQRVEVFGPLSVVPTLTAKATSAITPSRATLNGLIDPEGLAVTNCKFEYGTSTEYGKTAPCEGLIPVDSSDHPITAALSGLTANTEYHFRIVATNANGASEGDDQTFTTTRLAVTGEATGVTGTKATLHGTVFPEGEAITDCYFEYVSSIAKTAPCEGAIPPDEGGHAVTAALTHLLPNEHSYQVRLFIERDGEVIEGDPKSFKTANTVITGNASAINPPTATVEGTINPEGIPLTDCRFEYGPTEALGSSAPCSESPAEIGEGTSPVSVHANLSGLAFEKFYRYRLVATNVDGSANGKIIFFGTPGVPTVSERTAGVTETTAELIARINPQGLATTYHLEYGTTTSYGQSTDEAEVGTDEFVHTLTKVLEGLTPDTTYHWRAVASNSHGVTTGPDRSFTTHSTFGPDTNCANQEFRSGTSANLPDCRAYEMVSPPAKLGEVFSPDPTSRLGGSCFECQPGANVQMMPVQSTVDGGSIAYVGHPFSVGLASSSNQYVANRASGGWATQPLSSSLFSGGFSNGYKAFSPDLSRAVITQVSPPALSADAPTDETGKSFANLYLRNEDGSLRALVSEDPPHRSATTPDQFDAFRIVYSGANAGTATAPALSHIVFEANDTLTPATADAPAPLDPGSGESYNLYEWVDGQLRLINVAPGNTETAPGATIGSGRLLTGTSRLNGRSIDHAISDDGSRIFWSDESGQAYIRINGKETREIANHAGKFLTATPDGSKVLLSDGCLYDVQAEICEEDLTQGEGGFEGILGAAEDLSRIYFVDTKVLTGGEENANHEQAEAGRFNLYTWHGGSVTFIGVLTAEDETRDQFGSWIAAQANRTAQVSSDGRYLAFMSRASLTGYDNTVVDDHCFKSVSTRCTEIFEYDAATASLSCPSCNPTGQQPLGGSSLSLIAPTSDLAPFPQPSNLTDQGRLFFGSVDTLTPRDTNGFIQDVYQWKPNGVGGCERSAGCLSLISSGHSPHDSMFVDATPSGSDVFFVTREQLLLRDKDDYLDLYDARVNGGISENTPPPCLGEACKGPSTVAPEQSGPGSSTFSGPGNEKPKKAKKHKKKRRKHAHKHKSQKRSAKHNSGGSK